MNEKQKKTGKIIRAIALICAFVWTLAGVTYSWIKREWSPSVIGNNITIASEGSLVFSLDNNFSTAANIFELLGLDATTSLKSVSSVSGKAGQFFYVDNSDPYNPVFSRISDELSSAQYMRDYGFIDISFSIQTADPNNGNESITKYLFLNPGSYIQGSSIAAEQSVRVAISFSGSDPIIFRNQVKSYNEETRKYEEQWNGSEPLVTHTGVTNEYNNDKYVAEGVKFIVNDPTARNTVDGKDYVIDISERTDTGSISSKAHMFSDFYGGLWSRITAVGDDGVTVLVPYYVKDVEDNDVMFVWSDDEHMYVQASASPSDKYYRGNYSCVDEENQVWYYRDKNANIQSDQCLTVIQSGKPTLVNMRIWLEGTDLINCTEIIRNEVINLYIAFDAVDVVSTK